MALEEKALQPNLPAVKWMVAQPGRGTPILGEVTAGGMVESIVFDPGEEPDAFPFSTPTFPACTPCASGGSRWRHNTGRARY